MPIQLYRRQTKDLIFLISSHVQFSLEKYFAKNCVRALFGTRPGLLGLSKCMVKMICNWLATINPIKRGRGSHMTLTLSKLIFSTIYIMKKIWKNILFLGNCMKICIEHCFMLQKPVFYFVFRLLSQQFLFVGHIGHSGEAALDRV